MKEIYFEACEALRDELEREPTDAEIEAKYRDRVERLIDHADMLRKRAREEGF
jgi:hypothetical protein